MSEFTDSRARLFGGGMDTDSAQFPTEDRGVPRKHRPLTTDIRQPPSFAGWQIRVRQPAGEYLIFPEASVVSLSDEQGKGVSGKLADISVAPGGSAFSLVFTHDGGAPDYRRETSAEEVAPPAEGALPERMITIPQRVLRAAEAAAAGAATTIRELEAHRDQLIEANTDQARQLKEHRDQGKVKKGIGRVVNIPTPQYPRQRVVTEHGDDGSVTIRVELR